MKTVFYLSSAKIYHIYPLLFENLCSIIWLIKQTCVCLLEGRYMNYKELIIELLKPVKDTRILKLIYEFVKGITGM